MIPTSHTIGQNIIALANACRFMHYSPDHVLDRLNTAFLGAKYLFEDYEEPLVKLQEVYSKCIAHLKAFSEIERELVHAIITLRTECCRHSAFLPIFDKDIAKIEGEINGRSKKAKSLQQRILRGIGDKTEQNRMREQLLIEMSSEGTKLSRMKELRDHVAARVQKASSLAKITRTILSRKTDKMDIDMFKEFEEIIEERESLKAEFFLVNGWSLLLIDCKIQNAFDAILRETIPTPPTFWNWICCRTKGRYQAGEAPHTPK